MLLTSPVIICSTHILALWKELQIFIPLSQSLVIFCFHFYCCRLMFYPWSWWVIQMLESLLSLSWKVLKLKPFCSSFFDLLDNVFEFGSLTFIPFTTLTSAGEFYRGRGRHFLSSPLPKQTANPLSLIPFLYG